MNKTNKTPNTKQDNVNQTTKTNQTNKGVNVMNNYKLTGILATQINKLNYKEKGNIDKFDYQDPIHIEIIDIIRQTTTKEDLLILEQAERIYRQMANRFTKANRTQRAYVQQRIDNNKDLIKEVLKADQQQQSLFETKIEQAKQETKKDITLEPQDIKDHSRYDNIKGIVKATVPMDQETTLEEAALATKKRGRPSKKQTK